MQRRSPLMVVVLSVITLCIYALYWLVITKREMTGISHINSKCKNPHTSLLLVPMI